MKNKFMPNNINFRMYGAKARALYSNSQSFALSQLQSNKAHNFSQTAIEILLLKYDMWFKWLIECESILRKEQSYDRVIREELIFCSNTIHKEYAGMIEDNMEYFDYEFTDVWIKCHKSLYDLLIESVLSYEATSITDLIIHISNTLIKVMDATLYELQEVDSIIYTQEDVFISVSDVCFEFIRVFPNRCMLSERLEVFKTIRGEFDMVDVKLYTEVEVKPIFEKLGNDGYTIRKVI